MYLLLIAYDFPPTPSPQALRWIYLVRALSDAGHRVEVIAPKVPGYGPGGLPEIPASVVVHRVFPGRMTQFLLGRGGVSKPTADSILGAPQLAHVKALNWKGRLAGFIRTIFDDRSGLNWKGRLAEKLKAAVSNRVFPDYRIEWVKHALKRLDVLLEAGRPDVVVVSHEPACTLPVGLAAARRGLPLVVDMGDPVLAPYTPDRWRKKAFELEGSVCRAAMLISVTTEAAAQVLQQRHQLPEEKLIVIRQGFNPDFRVGDAASETAFDPDFVELLYTGSFYSFRRAEALLDAVLAVPGVRLSIASVRVPDYLVDYADRSDGRIRLLGFLSHTAALVAQRSCDILINLANEDPVQVPGKVFEYMGAGKPIMHLRGKQQDATGALMTALQAGWDVPSEIEVIRELLAEVCALKRQGELSTFAPNHDQVKEFSWPHLAETWFSRVESNLQASLHRQ